MTKTKKAVVDDDPINSIGKTLTGEEQRDAVHIAILPCQVTEDYMRGGQEVGLVYGTKDQIKSKESVYGLKPIGVIDPFLRDSVTIGDWVWVFLFPNSVTGMRHHWKHPVIDEAEQKWNDEQKVKDGPEEILTAINKMGGNDSEEWLKKFADQWNFNYDQMIESAQKKEGYVTANGRDLHGASGLDSGDEKLFWHHIQQMTGKEFDDEHKGAFTWSCSC